MFERFAQGTDVPFIALRSAFDLTGGSAGEKERHVSARTAADGAGTAETVCLQV